jgi:hypothetical protein
MTMAYDQQITENVRFLGDRANDLADQEIERARGLDTKAAALIAGSLVIVAAGATFASRLGDVNGGSGAKTLWSIEFGAALLLVLLAGLFAVLAMRPRAFRTAIAYHELEGWVTRNWLAKDPTFVRGKILHANLKSVGHAREQNNRKAGWLKWSFLAFASAMVCIVALGISVAVHAPIAAGNASTSSVNSISRTTTTTNAVSSTVRTTK